MNYFTDGSLFRYNTNEQAIGDTKYKELNIVYNMKGNTYLDKALDGIPIECCINNLKSDNYHQRIDIQKTESVNSSGSLEKINISYKNNEKNNYKKYKKCKNNKINYKKYKNYDIDNICEFCGILGCFHLQLEDISYYTDYDDYIYDDYYFDDYYFDDEYYLDDNILRRNGRTDNEEDEYWDNLRDQYNDALNGYDT
jgi:hypothetical protein